MEWGLPISRKMHLILKIILDHWYIATKFIAKVKLTSFLSETSLSVSRRSGMLDSIELEVMGACALESSTETTYILACKQYF